MRFRIYLAGLSLPAVCMAVTACSSAVPPPRASQPQPVRTVATPTPPTPTTSQPPVGSWTDWPITPGNWVYRQDDRGSIALFGQAGRDALVTFRCDKARGRIYVSRANENGSAASNLTIRSSTALKQYAAAATGSSPAYIAAEIAPTDNILDAMAYTRGRIALETSGQQSLAIPVWSELPRVIDDCR
jgi:hypothetical protein